MESMTRQAPCHLCVTHSPLVTRVFESAMGWLSVPDDMVRTISRRGAPFRGVGLCLDELSDQWEDCFRKGDKAGYHELGKRLDAAIQSLTGGRPFEAYIPHANKILYQEIITHPDCAGYSFIEEGFTAMSWSTRKNARFTPWKIFRNHLRTWWIGPRYQFKRPMFVHTLPHFRAAYAISGQAFRGMPGRADVRDFVPPFAAGNPPGKTYLVLDSFYLHFGVRWEDYENALVEVLLACDLPAGDVCVKFHFADAGRQARFESIRRLLGGDFGPRLTLLDQGFSVEDHLTQEDLVCFAFTSLGYYAALAGTRVMCFADRIHGASISKWVLDGRLPEDFLTVVGNGNG